MREILFRGKGISTGIWTYGFYIYDTVFCEHIIRSDGTYYVIDLETVGQFTGLLDKNGVKIFEGDIVFGNFGDKDFVGEVFYENANFMIKIKNNLSFGLGCCFVFLKVIGNIHDNPELMEGEIGQ